MKHENTIAGILLLGFCAITYWLTTGFSAGFAMLSQNVPPTFFPRVVLFILAVLSIILIFTGVLAYFLGTLVTLAVIAIVLPIAWGERRYRLIATLAICLPISIYIVFTLGLDVRFPAGRLLDAVL